LGAKISVIFPPQSTTQSPQIHQQISIKKHTNFQNPPQKRPQNGQKSRLSLPEFLSQIRIQKSSPTPQFFPAGFS
jgi:hypothetical protein